MRRLEVELIFSAAVIRVSNLSSPDTYNRRLLHEAQDDFLQN